MLYEVITTMSTLDETLKANEAYAKGFTLGALPMPPSRRLAILACIRVYGSW